MKRLFLIMIVIFVFVGIAHGSPFLVSDPASKWTGSGSGVEYYTIVLDSVEYRSDPQDLGNGTVRLYFDLAGISVGMHQAEVKAGNMWGESSPAPFEFTKSLPAAPIGIGLSGD